MIEKNPLLQWCKSLFRKLPSGVSVLAVLILASRFSRADDTIKRDSGARGRPKLIHGSGRWWRVLEAEAGDGSGPGYIVVQVAVPVQGHPEYDITVIDRWSGNPNPVGYARFKGDIRFTKVEGYENPANDIWDKE